MGEWLMIRYGTQIAPDEEEPADAPPPPPPPAPSDFARLAQSLAEAKQPEDVAPVALPPAAPEAAPPMRRTAPGYGSGLNDAALSSAQRRADRAASMANWGRTANDFTATFLGTKADNSSEDAIAARGQAGVDAIEKRRAGVGQELDLKTKQSASEKAADDADPASQSSLSAVEFASGLFPGLAPMLKGKSRAEIHEGFPLLEKYLARNDLKKKAGLDAAGEAAVDREIAKIAPDFDTSGLPYEQKKELLGKYVQLRGIKGVEHRGEESARQRDTALTNQARGLDQGDTRLGLKQRTQNFHEGQSDIQGYGPADPSNPIPMSSGDASDMKKQVAAQSQVHTKGQEVLDILQKHGGRMLNPSSTDMALVRQKLIEIQPLLTTGGGFGNFTNGHQHLVQSLIDDPTALSNLLNTGRLPAQINELMHSVDAGVAATAKANNLIPLKAGERQVHPNYGPKGHAGAGGTIQMVDPDGNVHDVPASDAGGAPPDWKKA